MRGIDVCTGFTHSAAESARVPTDEVLFAVFTADSANIVSQTCDRAGIPAQRVTTATEVDLEPRL